MGFPLTLNGTVTVPFKGHEVFSAEGVLKYIADAFERDRRVYYDVENNTIKFKIRRLFIGTWWSDFGSASSGYIKTSQHEGKIIINYDLNLKYIFTLCIIGGIFISWPLYLNPLREGIYLKIGIPVFAILWLYGGNYIYTAYKFSRYLKRLISAI